MAGQDHEAMLGQKGQEVGAHRFGAGQGHGHDGDAARGEDHFGQAIGGQFLQFGSRQGPGDGRGRVGVDDGLGFRNRPVDGQVHGPLAAGATRLNGAVQLQVGQVLELHLRLGHAAGRHGDEAVVQAHGEVAVRGRQQASGMEAAAGVEEVVEQGVGHGSSV